MTPLLMAVALFGLVHPGSKWILDTGLSLEAFCLATIGLRACALLAFAPWKLGSWRQFGLVVLLGGVGALLQISEFVGIKNGVPVSTVSFLIYSYPLWILLIGRLVNGEAITGSGLAKAMVSLAGVLAIVFAGKTLAPVELGAPLAASLFMALWICLSSAARKSGVHPLTISLYYDSSAFFFILVYVFASGGLQSQAVDLAWLGSGANLLRLAGYAILIGLVPNLLFFHASRSVPALTSGLVLLLEPVISTLVSGWAWGDEMGAGFALGAALILIANFPFEILPVPVQMRGIK